MTVYHDKSSNYSHICFSGIVFHPTHISLKDYLAKVPIYLLPMMFPSSRMCVSAIGQQLVNCSPVEFVTINPPSGKTCGQYMQAFISSAGGYLANPEASASCRFCSVRSSDQFLAAGFNIFYRHHWRNFGFMIAFIVFNVSSHHDSLWKSQIFTPLQICCTYAFTYLFRIRTGSLLPTFKRSAKKT